VKLKVLKLNNEYKVISELFIEVGNNSLSSMGWEKNWLFFEHHQELCFIYSLCPFIVWNSNKKLKHHQVWHWNEKVHLRGGTSPILVDNNYYIFAHTKCEYNFYRIVILQFDLNLNLKKRSKILDTLNRFQIVFPTGVIFVINEQTFYLTCGVEDREQYIVQFSKLEIDNLLFNI
jgi:hypothetical protein